MRVNSKKGKSARSLEIIVQGIKLRHDILIVTMRRSSGYHTTFILRFWEQLGSVCVWQESTSWEMFQVLLLRFITALDGLGQTVPIPRRWISMRTRVFKQRLSTCALQAYRHL